jgi:hypothetical protein
MAAIATLIDKLDTFELVGEQIAAILATELANQQQLAADAGKDPSLWKLRVFRECSNPWEQFLEATDPALDTSPIVNVAFEDYTTDWSASDRIQRQKVNATYNLDCFGCGISADAPTGHDPGDTRSALEVHRAIRLVRNILMAGTYTYLGLQGTVWTRGVQGVRVYQPQIDDRPVQHVLAARISFEVTFNEFSPQYEGETLEMVTLTVNRMANGQIVVPEQTLLETQYDH